jgi:hypothetical protein
MSNHNRKRILEMIDEERQSQLLKDEPYCLEAEILILEEHLMNVRSQWMRYQDKKFALESVKDLAVAAVRCLENHKH